MKLSIIIPTKDRLPILTKTLKALVAALGEVSFSYELIVISNSEEPEKIESIAPQAKVFENPRNKNSVFCSRNYGVSIAKGEVIILLDDDIIIPEASVLEGAIHFHEKYDKACFNPDWVYPPRLQKALNTHLFGRYLVKYGYAARRTQSLEQWQPSTFETKDIASFFLCIKREDFLAVGGYDESIPFEGTDHDISQRIRDASIKIYTEPSLMVYHNEEDRQEMRPWLMRQCRMGGANRIAYQNGLILSSLEYTSFKKNVFNIIFWQKDLFFMLLKLLPNNVAFDWLGFKVINILQGAHICKGYYSISN